MSAPPAVVRVAWTPGRAEPAHRAEMTTCWRLGETVEVVERREPWIRVRGGDGYEAWTTAGSLLRDATGAAWEERATLLSLGTRLEGGPDGSAAFAPWGARLEPAGGGRVRLPGGEEVEPERPERLVPDADRPLRFRADPAAAAATARAWLGAPYLWGGRMREGVDCSGLVQAVFELHGMPLPRDSRDQARRGRPLGTEPAATGPGDLVFFAWGGAPVSHVGIALGDGHLLHASETRGGVGVDDLGAGDPFVRRLREGIVAVRRVRD